MQRPDLSDMCEIVVKYKGVDYFSRYYEKEPSLDTILECLQTVKELYDESQTAPPSGDGTQRVV
jgi:hypothetical protein